ncbi:MAG: stage IV sporulation protein A [Bacillota bacterium]|nr:stage IV sporulation protein A [Bacillota bacterium]
MNIYKDIAERTQGDIYVGVVGPVRTGKSTFIKRFMDTMVLPKIDNAFKKERATDELPQSAAGKTIMTTEPKFVPNEAVNIKLGDANCNVRLIDCVGYMVRGAIGAVENNMPRMVQTPWSDEPMPFNEAAETGTKKVICEHSTIGLVITTDGSITEIPRADYEEAEERVIKELKEMNKPFILLINSTNPHSDNTKKLKSEMEEKYSVPVMPVSCADMNEEDFSKILEKILYEFPLTEIGIDFPSWLEVLPKEDKLKCGIYDSVISTLKGVKKIREAINASKQINKFDFADSVNVTGADLGTGAVRMAIVPPPELFYNVISQETGFKISGEENLLSLLMELKDVKKQYDKIEYALKEVDAKGYGIVAPTIDELMLEEPEIVKQGSRFGVRLKASAPSIHMIKAQIETEVSPIVGTERQSEELVKYLLDEFAVDPKKIWESNIFGKSLHELVNEGLHNKLSRMPEESRFRLQETLQKIINEGCGGLICIIL